MKQSACTDQSGTFSDLTNVRGTTSRATHNYDDDLRGLRDRVQYPSLTSSSATLLASRCHHTIQPHGANRLALPRFLIRNHKRPTAEVSTRQHGFAPLESAPHDAAQSVGGADCYKSRTAHQVADREVSGYSQWIAKHHWRKFSSKSTKRLVCEGIMGDFKQTLLEKGLGWMAAGFL
jgi:hypothetical protein